MSATLTILRIANIVVWSALLAYMMPGTVQAVLGKAVRRGDPMRLGVAAVSVVMILGNLRWLLAPDSVVLLAAISALGLIVGIFKVILAWAYGRGEKL